MLGKISITHQEYEEHGKFGVTTIRRRIGSWSKAVEKANLQPSRSPWNIPEDELFDNLQQVWLKLGRQPRRDEMMPPLSKFSGSTYHNRFGGWKKALERFVEIANGEISEISGHQKSMPISNHPMKRTKRQPNYRQQFIVMKRDNSKCRICGRSPATDPKIILHIDHIVPWSKGGETTIDNLQTLCSVCNIGKSNLD